MPPSDFEDLKAPLFRLFNSLPAKSSRTFLLLPLWREAVGPLAERTALKSFEGGRLTVEVDPAFLDDLNRARDMVLRRLNARLNNPFRAVERLELTPAPGAEQRPLAYLHSRRGAQKRPLNGPPR